MSSIAAVMMDHIQVSLVSNRVQSARWTRSREIIMHISTLIAAKSVRGGLAPSYPQRRL